MKISYSWIKDFMDIKLSPDKLAKELTMAGLSVDSLGRTGDDWTYDIEVVSNRPDWLSARGIAREVAAITDSKIKNSSYKIAKINPPAKGKKTDLDIDIKDKKGCSFYYGNLINGVKVAESPEWLKKKLTAVGLRPINNVVDITNYCLIEFGQPLHAFDFDKLKGSKIVVRRAKKSEKIKVIDGTEKNLSEDILVIADAQRPVAVAGIMGGMDTEVNAATKNILLESAFFDPVLIRRGSRLAGLASDSSYRFERGVDCSGVKEALDKATQMLCDICGGILSEAKFSGRVPVRPDVKIRVDLKEVGKFLGTDIPLLKARSMLEKLGFSVTKKSGICIEVRVPSFRRDVKLWQDVAEELARVYGYDNIPVTGFSIKPFAMEADRIDLVEAKIKSLLVSCGLKEIITYSLLCEDDYKKSGLELPADTLVLENPLTRDYAFLRTTLLPSILSCASININRGVKDLEVFEIARVFVNGEENRTLGFALAGSKRSTWLKESRKYELFDLKGILETIFSELQIKNFSFRQIEDEENVLRRYEAVCKDKVIASFGEATEHIKKLLGIKYKEDIFVAEVSIEELTKAAVMDKVYEPLVSVPSVVRDISVLAKKSISYAQIERTVRLKGGDILRSVSLSELYQGKEIPDDCVGLTISLEYRSDDKTLTDEEVNVVHQKILDEIAQKLNLSIR